MYGLALVRAGQFEEAVSETEHALRMSPLDTFAGLYTVFHGLALLAARRFPEAFVYLRRSDQRASRLCWPLQWSHQLLRPPRAT